MAAIESSLSAHHKLIPARLSLDFSSVPPTHKISDPSPEPQGTQAQNGLYLNIRSKIQAQHKTLTQLSAVGDQDLDRRLDALIERSDSYLQLLDQLRDDAWTEFVLIRYMRSLSSSDEGPQLITPGAPVVTHCLLVSNTGYLAPLPGSWAKNLQPFIVATLILVAVCHTLAEASQIDVTFLMAGIKAILSGALLWGNISSGLPHSLTDVQSELLKTLPYDIRAVLKRLDLEPEIIRYAVCPKCRAIYAPDPDNENDPYPRRCTFRETDKGVCGETLVVRRELREGKRVRVKYDPIRFFPYRSMHSWLAELFQRPELAALARGAWKAAVPPGTPWKDIWDAPLLRNFLGPDGRTRFSVQPEGCAHLVFSLFIDWFNPYGNKKAGKSHSIGAIYLVCLNLPPDIRYRPENIYLAGIIPGPHEPGLHQLNHFLRPLIDDLLVLWHRGILLTTTASDDVSLLVRAAVIPLVCDLPALRKAAGFAGHSSEKHFCSFCQLPRSQIKEYRRSKWPRRTRAKHQCYAEEWKNAKTEAEREAAFKKHGIRWSELLRLPYWDPTRFALVDAMHNLFLGDLRHHCREFWGIDIKDKSDTAKVHPHTPEEQATWLQNVATFIKQESSKKLDRARKGYLAAVAELNGAVSPAAGFTKRDYIDALLAWVRNGLSSHLSGVTSEYVSPSQWKDNRDKGIDIRLPPVFEESTRDFHLQRDRYDVSKFRILDQDTLFTIRTDILNTIIPSWMQRVPKNFGSPSHGKLKADQWRTGCLVNLVITLVRLWGVSTATPRQRMLLENFLNLVRATDLATRRTMDQSRVEKFDRYMTLYVSGLVETFKHPLVPNHHLSLHLRECLELFGPVHAWWAFPFERYNGILQHLNTNSRTSEFLFDQSANVGLAYLA